MVISFMEVHENIKEKKWGLKIHEAFYNLRGIND